VPPAPSDSEGREKLPKRAGWWRRVPLRARVLAASLLALSLLLFFYAWLNTPQVRTNPSYISNIYRATPSPAAAPSPKPEPTAR